MIFRPGSDGDNRITAAAATAMSGAAKAANLYFFSSRFLGRVLRVGYFGHVGVSRDRIEIPETVRAMETTFPLYVISTK